MRRAARLYSVTELDGYLDEMDSLGEGRLAAHLRQLRLRHDMEGIEEVLAQIADLAPDAEPT